MKQKFWLVVLLMGGVISCSSVQSQEYDIDKPSPNGTYRVKVHVIPARPGKTLEAAHFKFFKGDKLVDSWDWQQEDWLDPSFKTLTPIDWIADNVLRIGGGKSPHNFSDEVSIVNNTAQNLDHVSFGYQGEQYWIFDLGSGAKIAIHPKPWFTVKGAKFGFGYSGTTRNGKRFQGIIETGERTSASSGPLKFEIVVKPGDLY